MRLSVGIRAVPFYLYKTILPFSLAPFHPLPLKTDYFDAVFAASLATLALMAFLCVFFRRREPLAAWLYFIVTLLPVLGIVQAGSQAASDRYMYLPSLGPFMLAGGAAGALFVRLKAGRQVYAYCAVVAALFAALSIITIRQERVWKDSLSLWSHEIDVYGKRVPLAYSSRGVAYEKLGDFKRAIEDYDTAISIDPSLKVPYMQRGVAYQTLGEPDRAAADFIKAIELDPGYAMAYYDLGLLDLKAGSRERAGYCMRKAASLGLKEAGDYLAAEGLR